MNQERQKGYDFAIANGLSATATIIASNKCYKEIFNSAVCEIGKYKLALLLCKAKNPCWAYYCLRDVSDLTPAQKELLQKKAKYS